MAKSNELGKWGELIAGNYLMSNGYRILSCNWKSNKGYELDIVAMKDGELHFVEVKTRSNDFLNQPENAIDKRKMQHLHSCAFSYMKYYNLLDMEFHFDSIGIVAYSKQDYTINFMKDIF